MQTRTVLILAVVASAGLAAAILQADQKEPPAPQPTAARTAEKPSEAELKAKLSPLQYRVTQQEGTEPPFDNAYWDNHAAGIYVDIVSGEPLFSSLDKYNSGTGWPSFTKPIEPGHVVTKDDYSWLGKRTEVRSRRADSHLGHVFDDGPPPTGQRYCMNSASLRFVPADQLAQQGYGEYAGLFGAKNDPPQKSAAAKADDETTKGDAPLTETATLAGGCFWGMEDILRKIPGVVSTRVGYTGGITSDPTYPQVHAGNTGHAEAVEVIFDPNKITYAQLLGWFFRMHDPTTLNRQGNDVGTSYRSAIFTHSDAQQKIAEQAKNDAQAKWDDPIVTEIVPAGEFYSAEEYHQDYLVKNPGGYTCHYLRD